MAGFQPVIVWLLRVRLLSLIVWCSGVYGVPQHARADWRLPSAKTSGCEAEALCADRTKGPLSAP